MKPETLTKLIRCLGVGLALLPRHIRADYAKKLTAYSDPAQRKIAEYLAERLQLEFSIKEKPRGTGIGSTGAGAYRPAPEED